MPDPDQARASRDPGLGGVSGGAAGASAADRASGSGSRRLLRPKATTAWSWAWQRRRVDGRRDRGHRCRVRLSCPVQPRGNRGRAARAVSARPHLGATRLRLTVLETTTPPGGIYEAACGSRPLSHHGRGGRQRAALRVDRVVRSLRDRPQVRPTGCVTGVRRTTTSPAPGVRAPRSRCRQPQAPRGRDVRRRGRPRRDRSTPLPATKVPGAAAGLDDAERLELLVGAGHRVGGEVEGRRRARAPAAAGSPAARTPESTCVADAVADLLERRDAGVTGRRRGSAAGPPLQPHPLAAVDRPRGGSRPLVGGERGVERVAVGVEVDLGEHLVGQRAAAPRRRSGRRRRPSGRRARVGQRERLVERVRDLDAVARSSHGCGSRTIVRRPGQRPADRVVGRAGP